MRGYANCTVRVATTMRMLGEQFQLGVLMGSSFLVAVLPIFGQKYRNRPDKIGHRTVAHRSIISPAKEIEIGKQYAALFESTMELVQDPGVERFVTTMADNVVRNSDLKGPVTVKVIRSPEVDSLSLPGGFIYLKSGLLLSAENEDEIAGAIAHQVAHAAARHWASEVTKITIARGAMLSTVLVPSASSRPAYPTVSALGISIACLGFLSSRRHSLAMPLAFLGIRRQDEQEADYLGLQYMYKAGYDPGVYLALLRRLAVNSAASATSMDPFDDMPPVSERIAEAQKEIRKLLPNSHGPTKPSPEFILMKSHL
jgi:predicted Zn-dependent protease